MTISVLIVDDSPLQSYGWHTVLKSQPDIEPEAPLEIVRAAAVAVDGRRG